MIPLSIAREDPTSIARYLLVSYGSQTNEVLNLTEGWRRFHMMDHEVVRDEVARLRKMAMLDNPYPELPLPLSAMPAQARRHDWSAHELIEAVGLNAVRTTYAVKSAARIIDYAATSPVYYWVPKRDGLYPAPPSSDKDRIQWPDCLDEWIAYMCECLEIDTHKIERRKGIISTSAAINGLPERTSEWPNMRRPVRYARIPEQWASEWVAPITRAEKDMTLAEVRERWGGAA